MQQLLIVDDEAKICDMLRGFFEDLGFGVDTTTSPLDALERIARRPPDVLLLDIRMKEMSGLEVLRRVKQTAPDLRVVMVTAIEDEEVARESLKLGAIDYVTKPLTMSTKLWAERFFGFPTRSAPKG